ncbi:MAG: hypothetical protein ABIP74_02845 [Candidatus Saccharimonas sp.]
MPLTIVERLVMKGPVTDSQKVTVSLEHDYYGQYQVMCYVSQSSPPSYNLSLQRSTLPAKLRPRFRNNLLTVAQPLDVGGHLTIFSDGNEVLIPGIIVGFEISV